ncbi:1-alkyl-2-acetylglycerophosphocholine esterase [Desulfomarina profundi]|uniref:1-alkyl-2-acetylglycerophosphocholine esterase n=1 Tax=Desulfomarina profundi TaxID=2772557 RepID=A0A8D5FPS5_9BACT|nr:GDSL-type esterase/lipase family protein [Desulfomarina profundi]BCL59574.1 1-alkyl-2-acetylglycerophosphocholine esterase [Desulfomarina profundi]
MIQILFIGDSLIAEFDWQSRLNMHSVQNFGIPGLTTLDLYGMLSGIHEQSHPPDVVVVMIGTNDILTDNYRFIHTLKKTIVQLRQDFPSAEVLLSSLLPMKIPELPANTIPSINTHLEALTMQTGCCFLDIYTKFCESEETIFQADGVHITKAAYEIWSRILLEHIAFLVEND